METLRHREIEVICIYDISNIEMNLKRIFDTNYDLAYNGVYNTEMFYYTDGTYGVDYDGYEVDYDTLNSYLYCIYKADYSHA